MQFLLIALDLQASENSLRACALVALLSEI